MSMTMSPGTYLAKRRQAAGLSVEDVALRIETAPHAMSLRDRVAWLRRIEQDVDPVTMGVAAALHALFPLSGRVLIALVALRDAQPGAVPAPHLCRACACSPLDACLDEGGRGCAWAEPDLCTACADTMAFAAAHGAQA